MKKTKKALASLAIAGMSLSMIPFNVFAASPVTRIAGVTAEQTAVQIAEQTGYTGTAILASSTSYGMVDALTAGPLAASLKAPILLTGAGNTLDAATKAELTKLAVKKVYVTSGTAVIKQGVIDELKGMGIEVEALGGYDRAETSVNIAKKMTGVTKVAVANTVVDALSIAAVASAANEPILLTDRDALPASVAAYLASAGVTASDVIGGTGVISDSVAAKLPSATRHAGMSAYDTNNQVIQDFAASLAFDNVYVANGVTGIDALAGAPLAAQTKSPIVLTDGKTVPAAAAFTYSKSPVGAVVTALGGEFVVPESVRAGVAAGAVTPDSNKLEIVSVSALDDSNKFLEIIFSKPVVGLQTSDITLKNADTAARYGIKEVKMSSNGLTATVELYAQDDDTEVLAYRQDYVLTVNANGTLLTTTFNRPYSAKIRVQDINVGDKEIVGYVDKGTNAGAKVTIDIPSNVKFDYEGALGELVQVWYDGDNKLVNSKILSSDAKVDAIEVTDNDEIKLLGEDKKYDISDENYTNTTKEKFAFYVDGEKVDIEDQVDKKYNFAKIGLDSAGDIEFVSAYALKDSLIVESIDGDEVVGVDGSGSFDAEDATIVKDGKVVALSDLKEGDLLFYSDDADDEDGYAEVLNKVAATGAIDEVFEDSIEVDGETYDFNYDDDVDAFNYSKDAIYITEDGDVEEVDNTDNAEALQAAGDVTLYTDYAGNLIYISGEVADTVTNSDVAVLTENIVGYKTSKEKIEIQAVNQDGDDLSFDMNIEDLDTITVDGKECDIDNGGSDDWTAKLYDDVVQTAVDADRIVLTDNSDLTPTKGEGTLIEVIFSGAGAIADAGSLVKLHLNDDGDLEELEFFEDQGSTKAGYTTVSSLSAGDKYNGGYKLTANTLLFKAKDGVTTDADDYVITKFSDYNGSKITAGNLIYNDDQEVVAVWYSQTSSDDYSYDEAVVTKVLRNSDKEIVSVTVYAGGKLKTIAVDDVGGFTSSSSLQKGDVVILRTDEDNAELVNGFATKNSDVLEENVGGVSTPVTQWGPRVRENKVVDKVDVGEKTVTFVNDSNVYKLADNGLVLDASDTSDISIESLADLRGETKVTIVLDAKAGYYTKFFVINKADAGDTTAPTASVTTASVPSGNDVVTAQSTETGTVYLVLDSANLSTVSDLDDAVTDGTAASAPVVTANTNTHIDTTGLAAGTYKVVAVDAAGNVSDESTGIITVTDGTAPEASISSLGDDNITLTFDEPLYLGSTKITNGYDLKAKFDVTGGVTITSAIYNAADNSITFVLSGAGDGDTIAEKATTVLKDAAGNAYVPQVMEFSAANDAWDFQ